MARAFPLSIAFVVAVASLASADAASANLASAVSRGGTHRCALTTDGGVWCWGYNAYGELGDGTTTSRGVPVQVPGLASGATAISADTFNTCALTTAGAVLCWGANFAGQLGNPFQSPYGPTVPVSGLSSGAAAISTSFGYSCALTTGGAVLCWGANDWGQFGNGTTLDSALPVPVSGLSSGVSSITTGGYNTCALTTTGAALCWGTNSSGVLGDGTFTNSLVPVAVSGLSNGVAAISLGLSHACALTTAGSVLCWGGNSEGQLGNGSLTESNIPVAVSGLSSGVAEISAGAIHTCARTTGGGVLCWGDNQFGALGDGTTTSSNVPVAVTGLSSGATALAAGSQGTCVLTTNGSLKCWGTNGYLQLGIGPAIPYASLPTPVLGFGPEAVPALGAPGLLLLSATLIATFVAHARRRQHGEGER